METMNRDLFGQSELEIAVDVLHERTSIYTSLHVVDEILSGIRWPDGRRKMVESACGDGAFLGQALSLLLKQRPGISHNEILDVLEAWEIHFAAVAQARSRIRTILVTAGWRSDAAQRLADALVRHGDYILDSQADSQADIHVGNPPYVRALNIPEPLRSAYIQASPDWATADLLHTFLERCTARLTPDGEMHLVTADRWCSAKSASKLRAHVGQTLGVSSVRRLDKATSFYRPKQRRAGSPPRVNPIAITLQRKEMCSITLSAEPFYPDAGNAQLSGRAKLGDIANVRIGPWLGPKGVFVVSSAVAASLPSHALVPVVEADDIVAGRVMGVSHYAIRTEAGVVPDGSVLAHLDATLSSMSASGRRHPRWVAPESFASLNLSQPSLMIPRIVNMLRPVELESGRMPIDHHLHITAQKGQSLSTIAQQLQRPGALEWIRARARGIENDYFELTAPLLRQLPVDV